MMESLLGTTYGVFFIVTIMVMGFAAYMTGQACANTWRPAGHTVFYCLMLGLTDRFLTFALFEGELLSLTGYVIDTAVLIAIALFAYRLNRAARLVTQYPWLYERTGLLTYRERP
tara:strand:+ start:4807 stop:5151 length:345 start_codon:yes stop_codon:yes gene_type:complete